MPYRAVAQAALDRWREAERRMQGSPPESVAWQQAYIDAELAKGEYQQAIDDARRERKPIPPPFEDVRGT